MIASTHKRVLHYRVLGVSIERLAIGQIVFALFVNEDFELGGCVFESD